MSRRPVATPPDALLSLDETSEVPLYRQLYDGLRAAILAGRLAPGTRLPGTRALADDLLVSRNTVLLAFDQLRAEGYLAGRGRSATRVAHALPDDLLRAPDAAATPPPGTGADARGEEGAPGLSSRGRALAGIEVGASQGGPRAFRMGSPALDHFPRGVWTRLLAARWRESTVLPLGYGDPAGFAPLRAAIAEYAAASRGVRCTPGQVIVTAGSQQGIDLAAHLLLDPGDRVWAEDPGYPGARAALHAAGAEVVPVPVDEEGMRVDEAARRAPDARMAYVTPSRHYPLGATMSAARRLALLRRAERTGMWVLEDDYDSEFRYATRPLASLQGMDRAGRVVYVGTFSKTLFPSLRLGYVIVPPALVEAFRAARAAADRQSPTMDQAVLADFLAGGHFARHVRRMRAVYAARQAALVEAAREHLGGRLRVEAAPGGMHLAGWLPEGMDDRAVSAAALARGIEARAVSAYALEEWTRPGLLLGYTAFSETTIRAATERLGRVLRGV